METDRPDLSQTEENTEVANRVSQTSHESAKERSQRPATESVKSIEFAAEASLKNERLIKFLSARREERVVVSKLSASNLTIADEIASELKRRLMLPNSVELSVSLEVTKGSIALAGLVSFMTLVGSNLPGILSTLSDGFSVTAHLKEVVSYVFRKSIEENSSLPIKSLVVTKAKEHSKENRLTKALWWCAGGASDILQNCPTDRAKYQCVGFAVVTTGVLATLSGGYALYTVFDGNKLAPILGSLFGIAWGAIIFNIDRAIVSSVRKRIVDEPSLPGMRKLRNVWLAAIPRLVLAIILGFVVAAPLELRLLQGPIAVQMAKKESEEIIRQRNSNSTTMPAITAVDAEIERLNGRSPGDGAMRVPGEIQDKEAEVSTRRDELNKEVDGTGGSMRSGVRGIAAIKNEQLSKAEFELLEKQNELSALQAHRRDLVEDGVQRIKDEQRRDFFAKMLGLSTLCKTEPSARWITLFITFLFILVELIPIAIKLFSPIGLYEVALNMRELVKMEQNFTAYEVQSARRRRKADSEIRGDKDLYAELDEMRQLLRTRKRAQLENETMAGRDWIYSDVETEMLRVNSHNEFL